MGVQAENNFTDVTQTNYHNMANKQIEREYQETITTLNKLKKSAYIPVVREGKPEFNSKSKFGGLPYLLKEDDWKICPECNSRMKLVLQLNFADFPSPIKYRGRIIQYFYCEEDASFHINQNNMDGDSIKVNYTENDYLAEKQITGWIEKDDYPHHEEYYEFEEETGLEYIDIDNEVNNLMEDRQTGLNLRVDKLFGWPYWEQEREYPYSELTDEELPLLFQIISQGNAKVDFGDDGIVHLFFDKDNEFDIKSTWACG